MELNIEFMERFKDKTISPFNTHSYQRTELYFVYSFD